MGLLLQNWVGSTVRLLLVSAVVIGSYAQAEDPPKSDFVFGAVAQAKKDAAEKAKEQGAAKVDEKAGVATAQAQNESLALITKDLSQNSKKLPLNPADFRSLDAKQIGIIRHILKLSRQQRGNFDGMGSDWTDIHEPPIQYQFSMGGYALGLAQYHFTPAYPDIYREAMDSYIQKLLHPLVWNAWYLISMGGTVVNPEQEKLFVPSYDPVTDDNIMYSGHLLQLAALYEMLYRDEKYTKPGAFTFDFLSESWGNGPQVYKHDLHDLAKIIHGLFKEGNYKGIACERNIVFAPCNQHPILGLMHYDHTYGTNYAEDVIPKFKKQWDERDYQNPESSSLMLVLLKQQEQVIYADESWVDAWTGMYMNAWDSEYIQSLYPAQRDLHFDYAIGNKVKTESLMMWEERIGLTSLLAYTVEMGDTKTSNALFEHLETNFSPTWEEDTGRYYYPRNDDATKDENGISHLMPTMGGNAFIPQAYLNIKDGFKALYNNPWPAGHWSQPHITGVDDLTTSVTQAVYVAEKGSLLVTLAQGPVTAKKVAFKVANLDRDKNYAIWKGNKLVKKISMSEVSKKGKYTVDAEGNLVIEAALSKSRPTSYVVAELNS